MLKKIMSIRKITLAQYIYIKDLRVNSNYFEDSERDSELTIIQASHLIKKLLNLLDKQKRGVVEKNENENIFKC